VAAGLVLLPLIHRFQNSGKRSSTIIRVDGVTENFKNAKTGKLYLSGHLFRGNGEWVQMIDQTITDTAAIIEKSLLCGSAGGPVNVTVDGRTIAINTPGIINRIPVGADRSRGIKLSVADERLPLYGVSFESASG
jgi:hypothetical protein